MLKLLFGSYQGSVLERDGADGTLETARRTIRMVVVATPLQRRNQEKGNTGYNF